MLSAKSIAERVRLADHADPNMLSIVPRPDLDALEASGAASIDLRLGRWFRTIRPSRTSVLDLSGDPATEGEDHLSTKEHFVPFGEEFVLHPRSFVLGITLEWIRIPANLGAYVTGKSSLGRRGLIIETASGIQPGFSGCLALELSNVGEIPIALLPGMLVCQIFLHSIDPPSSPAKSQFAGRRKPVLGRIKEDKVLSKLKS